MTGSWMFLEMFEYFTYVYCQPYTYTWFTKVLAITRATGTAVTIGLLFAGFLRANGSKRELYLLYISLGSLLDTLINWVLRRVIVSPLKVATCTIGATYNMPDSVVENVTFLITIFLTYCFAFGSKRLEFYHIAAIILWLVLTVYGSMYLNYSTNSQALVAALIGAVFGLIWQGVFVALIYPRWPDVLQWRVVTMAGYGDTFFLRRLANDPMAETAERVTPKTN